MPDRIIASGGQLVSADALREAAEGGGYVYKDQAGDLRLSTRHKGTWFFGLGTWSKHKEGFDDLKRILQDQYGFQLGGNRRALRFGNQILQGLNVAKAANRDAVDQIVNQVAGRHADLNVQPWTQFDQAQGLWMQQQLQPTRLAGKVVTPNRLEQLNETVGNREDRLAAKLAFSNVFGDVQATKFDNDTAADRVNDEPLSEIEFNRWSGYFAGKEQANQLATTFRAGYDGPQADAVRDHLRTFLHDKLDDILAHPSKTPPELMRVPPELPQNWIDEGLESALTQGQERIETKLRQDLADVNVVTPDQELRENAADRKRALLGLITSLKASTRMESTVRRQPVRQQYRESARALFAERIQQDPGAFYDLCRTVQSMNAELFTKQWVITSEVSPDHVAGHLRTIKRLAALGLQLEARNVTPEVASTMLEMELVERTANRGAHNRSHWSPEMANRLNDCAQFATRFNQSRADSNITPPETKARVFQHLLRHEMEERQQGRNLNRDQWSPRMQGLLANHQAGLNVMVTNRIPADQMMAKMHEGAHINITHAEAVSCIRLGLDADHISHLGNLAQQGLGAGARQQFADQLQVWGNAGFNRAEAFAYMHDFQPNEIRGFAGWNLTPAQIRHFQRRGLTPNAFTRIGHYVDQNQTGAAVRLGNGAFNTTYSANYTDYGEPEPRVFKSVVQDGRLNREELNSNLATQEVTRMLGSDVTVKTEVGIQNNEIGLSMELAPGKSAHKQAKNDATITVTAESPFRAFLKHKDFLRQHPDQARFLAKRLGVEKIFIDPETQELKITNPPLAYSKKDPVLQKKMVDLQLVDYLTNQRDRHMGNYFVGYDEHGNVTRVAGIDNDFTFELGTQFNGSVGGFPPVIDRQQAGRILAIDEVQERQRLAPLLTRRQLDKFIERVGKLKEKVREYEQRNLIIQPNEWGDEFATERLLNNPPNMVYRDARRVMSMPLPSMFA